MNILPGSSKISLHFEHTVVFNFIPLYTHTVIIILFFLVIYKEKSGRSCHVALLEHVTQLLVSDILYRGLDYTLSIKDD